MSYYDIDAVITEAEKVPCKFDLDVADLGSLDNNSNHPLKAGTIVNLPLWMAELLAIADTETPFINMSLPKALSDEVMAALKADPRAVPIKDQSFFFYALGVRMLDLFEETEMGAVLRKSFVTRAGEVALRARKAGATGQLAGDEEFERGTDDWERKLWRAAHDGTKGHKEWMEGVKK